ncbi:mitochondrial ribosomal subunit S27-domain-containing protein [Usnea florida]
MSVSQSRILDLLKVQCRIFSQTFNPSRLRTGNRVLRQRLRGPSVAAYYPRRVATMKDLMKAYKGFDEQMVTWDDDEEDRLDHIKNIKSRGKGAPKKKRTADESKKMKGKKRPAVAPEPLKESKF